MRELSIDSRRQPSRSVRFSPVTGDWKLAAAPARAFTLTEVLISLAMVSILLIGISRIFSLTSQTIGTGQALSAAVRTQRSVQQTISDDMNGPAKANPDDSTEANGMLPLNDKHDVDRGMPFIMITNFRVPTYRNAGANAADVIAPPEPPPTSTIAETSAQFIARSRQIRGADLNKDGVENTTSITAGGETTPLFAYGDRNFRCDTVGFFSRGAFQSQTGVSSVTTGAGTDTSFQGSLTTNEAYIWYGHLRIYNSEPSRLDRSNAMGDPGDWQTRATPYLPNRNNRYAEQFVLGRTQLVLSEPTDHDGRIGSYNPAPSGIDGGPDRKLAEENTVVAMNDPSRPTMFLQRKWWDPNAHYLDSDKPDWKDKSRPLYSPLTINDPVVIFQPDTTSSLTGRNRTVYTSDRTTSAGGTDTNYQAAGGRTDVAGLGALQASQRCRFLQRYDDNYPPKLETNVGDQYEWWEKLFVTWNTRFWGNPFVATAGFNPGESNINAKSLAQRQQILTEGCSQFIVEFAGDFVTQNESNTGVYGEVTSALPDGITDFVVGPNNTRRIRWYGLPRDVDGDGVISTTPANAINSEDVLPVSIYAGTNFVRLANLTILPNASSPRLWLPFEKIAYASQSSTATATVLPTSGNNYMTNVDEPANATSPDKSGYVCVWGRQDFERTYTVPASGSNPAKVVHGAVPQMLRFIIDQSDPKQKLKEPVTQELVFSVPNYTGDTR